MNRATLLKRIREFHDWLKSEAKYRGNPYGGVAESMVDEAKLEVRRDTLARFEQGFGKILE